jgi:hypothetical protein
MDHHENQNPEPAVRRRRALSAAAVALLCAATLAACGGSDDDEPTTGTAAATATEQAQTTSSTATTTPEDDTASTDDTGDDAGAAPDNGFSAQTANNVLAAATTSSQQASSVHVEGAMGDVMLDLEMVRGEGAQGEIAQGENRFEIVAVGGRFFLKGSEDFYRQLGGEGVVELLGDRWLEAPTDDPEFASLAQLSDMDRLLGEILDPSGELTKGDVTDVDGLPAIPLTSDGSDGTLYVASTGTPFPLRIEAPDGRGEVVFSAWDEPVELTAPTDAVDISQLESSGTN